MKCPHCGEALTTMDIEFNFTDGTVDAGGKSVKLGPKQLHVLEHLIDAYPSGIAAYDLGAEVYADDENVDACNAIRANIHVIKAKFDEARFPWEIGRLSGTNRASVYCLMPRASMAFKKTA